MIFTEPTIDKFRILIIVTNPENILLEQYDFIHNYSSIACMTIEYTVVDDLLCLEKALKSYYTTFNLVYFIGHGDEEGTVIGNSIEPFQWTEIIKIINKSDTITNDCLFFIHSCYSYNSFDYILKNCIRVKSLVGFKRDTNNIYGYTSFFMFIFYIVFKGKSYKEAVEIINNTAYEDLHFLEK